MTITHRPAVWAVVPAAGIGRRMQSRIPKQYLPLMGRPVIHWSVESLLAHPRVSGCVVALSRDDPYWAEHGVRSDKPLHTVTGGAERFHSVLNCLDALVALADDTAWVLVHDAVRPCLTRGELDRLLDQAMLTEHGGLLAYPVRDTLKREDAEGFVAGTAERRGLWHAMTPQLFPLKALREALHAVLDSERPVTDEAQAMERRGFHPLLVEGDSTNLKITQPADLPLAESVLQALQRPR